MTSWAPLPPISLDITVDRVIAKDCSPKDEWTLSSVPVQRFSRTLTRVIFVRLPFHNLALGVGVFYDADILTHHPERRGKGVDEDVNSWRFTYL